MDPSSPNYGSGVRTQFCSELYFKIVFLDFSLLLILEYIAICGQENICTVGKRAEQWTVQLWFEEKWKSFRCMFKLTS